MRKLYSVLLSSLLFTGAFAQVPTSGLMAEWQFTGGAVTDAITLLSGSAQLGAVSTTDRFGNTNNAYDLPPEGYLTFGDLYDTQITGANAAFSYSFWVKFDEINSTYRYIIGKAAFEGTCSLGARQFAVLVNTDSRLEVQLFGDLTGGHKRYQTGSTLAANAWTHVAFSVQMNQLLQNNTSGIKIYINGVAQAVSNNETVGGGLSANGIDNGSAFLSAGRYNNNQGNPCGTTQYLDGQFDDLRIYSRVITAQEALDLYNETVCNQAVITTQPPAVAAFCSGGSTDISIAIADLDASLTWQINTGSGWGYLSTEHDPTLTVSTAASYRVETQSACGAYGYSDVTEVVVDAPAFEPVSGTPQNSYLCPQVGFETLEAGAVGEGLTYQWQENINGTWTDIVGENQSSFVTVAGFYQVVATACGTSVTSVPFNVVTGANNTVTVVGFSPGSGTICAGQSVNIVTQVSTTSTFSWSPANGTGTNSYSVSPTETTTYTVTATSWQGCEATATTTVTVLDLPEPVITESGGVLTASGGPFQSHQWYLEGNSLGVVVGTYTPTQAGNYTVTVTQGPCTGTSPVFNYNGIPTGVQTLATTGLKVYPNPFANEFVIETLEPTSIRIVNTLGEVLMARTINGRTSIDASSFSAGIYFVQEETSGAVMKLVKH